MNIFSILPNESINNYHITLIPDITELVITRPERLQFFLRIVYQFDIIQFSNTLFLEHQEKDKLIVDQVP